MFELRPVSTLGSRNFVPIAGFLEGSAGDSIFGGDLCHGLRPDLLIELFTRNGVRVLTQTFYLTRACLESGRGSALLRMEAADSTSLNI